ncbi:ImmA/IrrE family metallo-endopeptidase [Clostridium perfringens]|uniref:ImmA/IrrE family metallo-endopeptidase n=1 Tax=Clostridium perfringens TaxID=1502 RepID=UPI002A2CC4A1|nr:ImmA/IrrE family metallo-endopeptidase [Clostridium perfringens]
MNQLLRNGINNLADEVRNIFNISSPVQDIDAVVRMLGGEVVEELELENYADAKIEKVGDSFRITVLEGQPVTRRRFSIAHELGHLFLHMGYCIDEELWESNEDNRYFRSLSGEKEYQAHEFAAALLMPKSEFKNEMARHFNSEEFFYDMEAVAEYFNVSEEAAINRGRWLGMLSW